MTKPFNIHDWQAKQRQQRLTEGKLFEEDFKNPILDKYLKLKKSIDYKTVFPTDLQSFLDSLDNTERKGLKRDLSESLNPEVSRKVDSFIRAMADRYDYTMQDAVYAIMAALKQRNYDGLEEHHNDEDFPGKDLSAWDLLDKIKSSNEDLYNKVEDFMKSMKEMSTTGTGASFNAGSGGGYMTPNAFKKKKK
jgi:hypothetical protein